MERKRLLVVDDQPEITELIVDAFAEEYDVMTATSGEEAIRIAVLDHPSCILMDVMMPKMGGFMLCEILKSIKQTQLIPILMVSAKPRHEMWELAQELGAADYIEKPFAIEKLYDAVHRALSTAPIERRRTPRVKMKIPVLVRGKDLQHRDFELHTETEDVSRFGTLLRLPIEVPVGENVEIFQADFPGQEHKGVSNMARVVWHDESPVGGPYRHGLEFLNPSSHWVIRQ